MNGIINIYKPAGITSHGVVSRVRKFFGVKRVGHAGTLDPMATGVLPVLVGNAAVVQDIIMDHDKTYKAGVLFGKITDTGDITGNILAENLPQFDDISLDNAIKKYTGTQNQVPPMYSAIKMGGVKLYELARKGIEVERKAREITVYDIRLVTPFDGKRCDIEVDCSKGTYIRTLAEDIGAYLGCGACLDSLERVKCGEYTKENAVTLDELEELYKQGNTSGLQSLLKSPEALFADKPSVVLAPFYEKLSLNGAEIYLKKAGISENIFGNDGLCRIYGKDKGFYAVGELKDFPDGKAVKIKYRFLGNN